MGRPIKVPKYIQNKMHKVAEYSNKIGKYMGEIEQWLLDNDIDSDDTNLRKGDGYSLEELEYGNDCTELIVERLETGDY